MKHLFTYWTGLEALPVRGFRGLNTPEGLKLNVLHGIGNLFKASTCFYSLTIPSASTKEELESIFEESMRIPLTFSLA